MVDSSAPPAAVAHPAPDARYALPDMPKVAGLEPDRMALDQFRWAAAKVVGEAWGMEPEKIVPGVDVGELSIPLLCCIAHSGV